jgi:hypothetical protein
MDGFHCVHLEVRLASMTKRRSKALTAAVGLLSAFVAFWLGGMGSVLGVMGTDPCSGGVLEGIEWWLFPGYLIVLSVAAVVPPVLTFRGAADRWVVLSLIGILGVAFAWMAAWFAMVGERCT